jgi:hypothetical protein
MAGDRQRWSVPRVARTQAVQFDIVVRGVDGNELARNTLDLLVLPARGRLPSYAGHIAVVSGDSPSRPGTHLEQAVRAVGYHTTSRLTADTQVAVTNAPNRELLRWVRDGGDLLFLSNTGPSPFFWTQRRTGAYAGSWTTSFSWLRPRVHPRLTINNPLSLPFLGVMPSHTILGLPVSDRTVQPDFLAGMVSGWVRHPAVHTVQFRYGRGRVIMTTFALEQALPNDAVGVAMFHDLIEHLSSDACQPTLTGNYSP